MSYPKTSNSWKVAAIGLLLCGSLAPLAGCQVSVDAQTIHNHYYLLADVQYFPAGPQNKLANETAALEKARAEAQRKAR